MTTETEYQFHISHGFSIIRKHQKNLSIQMKNVGRTGWTRILKCKNQDDLDNTFYRLLSKRKILSDF